MDAGFIEPASSISGFVWYDLNENGLQNNGENGIAGVQVDLLDDNGTVVATTTTDANGNYIFNDVKSGQYTLDFDASNDPEVGDNYETTLQDVGSDESIDSDISQANNTVSFAFDAADGSADFDAGFTLPVSNIVGTVFNDENKDGLQDNNEGGIGGVTVTLFNADGTVVATTITDENGSYTFNDIMEGDYYIIVDVSTNTDGVPNYEGTLKDAGDDDFDSDVDPNTGRSDTFTHMPADGNSDLDAGFIEPAAAISGFVWYDLNENGLQNGGENGIEGVQVDLLDNNGSVIATTNTDANGNYTFNDVKSGQYTLDFDASNDPEVGDNYETTLQDIGSDETIDSDISQANNTVSFAFDAADGSADFDAGFTLPVSNIVGTVFIDENEDGLQGNNEGGIGGVTVTLYDAEGTVVRTTTTDENGSYTFNDIMEGDYYIIVDVSTNTDGVPNYEGTLKDAGDDDFDSDVDPNTGRSDTFTHVPVDGNSDLDAGFIEPTATITGFVWYDLNENGLQNEGENGIPGVRVDLLDGSGNVIANTTTDANGEYDFTDIKSNDYTLEFDASNDPVVGDNYETTLQDVGSDERFDSDISQTSNDVSFTFNASQGNADYDAGFTLPLANIMGIAFDDLDKNGLQGNNEPMIGGVTVTLFKADNQVVGTTTTDANGFYRFNEIMGGSYYVAFDISTNTAAIDDYEITIQDAGDDDFDSDIDPNTGRTATFTFNPADGDDNYDAGYFLGTGSVTGTVFNDLNENGLQDVNEPGIGGVEVTVIAPDGIPINASTSETDGSFAVDGIPSGTVTVLFDPDDNSEQLENLTPTIKDVNNNQNDDIDSDINPNKEVDPFNFDAYVGADRDAGFFVPVDPVMIGDFVFKDCNENGVQDPGEGGVPNVPVTLLGTDNLGRSVEMMMTTNSEGKYLFTAPRPGTYYLDFDIPEGVVGLDFSPRNRGNANTDSDVNPLSGVTDNFTIANGETNLSLDAGIIDKSPPLIFNVPPDITVDCNDLPNPPSTIKGVDNCDPSVPVTFSERVINAGSCPYIIERKWEASDECGNTAVRTQTITVTDTQAPIITPSNPLLVGLEDYGEITFNCDNLPEFDADDVNATDNCSPVEVEFVDLVREQGNCEADGFIVKMTCAWIAEDECGNRSTYNIVIYVVDTESPTLQNIPEDLTVNLDEGQFVPPVANTVTATDNCDEYVRVEFEETRNPGVCGYEIIRTWTGFDDCGNKAVGSQKLTLLEDCTCPDELVSNTLVWDAACDGSVGGMITLDLTADINKYDITITPNTGNTNFVGNMFTDLAPGNYTVMVNYEAAMECSETYNFTIKTATPSSIEVVKQTRADCNTANGTVTLSPSTSTYVWSDGGTGAQRNDLAAGTYTVTFTDENNCEGSQLITILNPDGCECIDFVANLLWEIEPTCNGFTNGQVDIEIIGGTAPFTYKWHDGQTTKDLFGVSGGPYSLTVTDANNCTATLSGDLNQPTAITVTETLMNGLCGEKGAIDVFVEGGTPPYTYNWNNGATTQDLNNLPTGTYSLTVTDANDCEGNLTVNVRNSGNISIDLAGTEIACAGDRTASITATVTGAQNPLTYQWSNGATTSTINNLGAGTYAVMVTDGTGCSATAELTITAPSMIMVDLSPSTPECGVTTGSINALATGGVAPYTYSWDGGVTTQNLTDVPAGTYGVTVTDATGCTGSTTATVAVQASIEAEATATNPACDGEMGSIILDVSGGRSGYTYAWSNGAITKDLTDVSPGNYTVTITDADDCSTTLETAIIPASGLNIVSNAINAACAGEGGQIQVAVNGGTAPYTYRWTNGATTKNIDNLTAGGYTLTVTDANGCAITTTEVLEAPTALAVATNPTLPMCFGMVGAIDITVSGGTGNYTYVWNFGAQTKDVEGLVAGTYTVTITDENGCQITATETIVVPDAVQGNATTTNPSCVGEGGTIDLNVTGGTAPYTYAWSNGATTEDLSDVPAGVYNVTITDANGCSTAVNAIVESTAGISLTEEITHPFCAGEADGQINLTVGGGNAPYTYSWTNGATTKDISNLMPGAYSVVVTDANGCELMGTYTLTAPTAIQVEAETDHPDCSDDTGQINITVSGGSAPYTFAWSNGATTEDLSEIMAGTYSGTITDANGCTSVATATLTAPTALTATVDITDQDCSGDGNIDLTVSGGTAPYSYVWSNGATTEDLTKVGGGTYSVVISDASNCKLTQEVVVQSTGGIEILVSGKEPTCPGGNDGSLTTDVKGGTQPYTYLWSDGSQGSSLNNIPAGSYSVTVMDAKGCSLIGSAVLNSAEGITATATAINPTCADESGAINVSVSGGNPPYTYSWTNGATTKDISNLTAGGYTVTITDQDGCSTTVTTEIVIPTAISIDIQATNPGCDALTGSITLAVSGGTAPYTYTWSNGSFAQNLLEVVAGTYSVTVVDAVGCQAVASATIEDIAGISIAVEGSSDPTCVGGTDGFIDLSISGGQAPYAFQWTNGATTEDLNNLGAGFYAVTISDARDCKVVLDTQLNDPTPIHISVNKNDPNCPNETGSIDISVTGGTAPYTYAWNNGATTEDLTNIGAGNYQVNVTDAKGCSQLSENISVVSPDDFSINLTAIDVKCYGEANGEVLLDVDGSGAYTFAWSNGQTSQNIANVGEGTYAVTVTNSNGCTKTAEATVKMPTALSMGMTFSNPECPNDFGAINITVEGGTPPYSYAWSNGATTEDVDNLIAGSYSIVVTDANGCILEGSANIRPATPITATITATNMSCEGEDGMLDLTVSGGSGTYIYAWSNGATAQDLSNLPAGNYEVTITDTKGCSITETATIGDDCVCPSPLVNQNMVTNARCGEANGFIMIMVNGDLNNFTFEWSPNVGTQGAFNNERSDLPAGTYDVTVTYAKKTDCQEVVRLAVGNRDGVSGSVVSNIPATCDKNDGQVILSDAVNYFWPDGSQSKNRSGLAPGSYTIRTLDGSGCEGSLTVTVTQEPCNVDCDLSAKVEGIKNPDCDGNLGSIELAVTGGIMPYTYEWSLSTIGNTNIATGLAGGDYSVVVTDANGCTVSLNAMIAEPGCASPTDPDTDPDPTDPVSNCNLSLSLIAHNLSCDGANDGTIKVDVFNGKAPYTYRWSTGESTESIANLAVDEYWVEVMDADGCRAIATIQITSPGRLVVTETRTVLDCEGIEIKLNVSGGRAPYKWECEDLTGTLLDPLSFEPGTYNCVITDGSGCSVTHTLVIEDYQPLDVTGVVTNTTCGQEDGSIDLTPTGGTAPYTFEWDCGLYGDEDQFNLGVHTYNVTVTDATNCFVTATFSVADCNGESFDFVSVNAEVISEQNVKVSWETQNEVSTGNYVLQHSMDGENFTVVGQPMEGKGPIETANYEMEESANYGMNYYRIKYIDLAGNEYYSEIAQVEIAITGSTGRASIPAIVYPNPTHDAFTLDFARPLEAVVKVLITDMDGVVLREVELQPGTPKMLFDIVSFDAGLYNITLQQQRKKLKSYRILKVME
ncbi:MAG: SdrD B-like domain-containing protein [Bacteroidota bacterium]